MKYAICAFLFSCACLAQNLTVGRDGERVEARSLGEHRWSFELEGRTYFIVAKDDLKDLAQEAETATAGAVARGNLLACHDTLLQRISEYRSVTARYLQSQEEVVTTGRRLTAATQEAYREALALAGLNPFSLTGGLSLFRTGETVAVAGTVGLAYRSFLGQVHIGAGFQGVSVGLRLAP